MLLLLRLRLLLLLLLLGVVCRHNKLVQYRVCLLNVRTTLYAG